MPKLIATHEVDDVAHWLASPKRAEVFGSAVTNIRTYVDPGKPQPGGPEHGRFGHGRLSGCHGERRRRRSDAARWCASRHPGDPHRELRPAFRVVLLEDELDKMSRECWRARRND